MFSRSRKAKTLLFRPAEFFSTTVKLTFPFALDNLILVVNNDGEHSNVTFTFINKKYYCDKHYFETWCIFNQGYVTYICIIWCNLPSAKDWAGMAFESSISSLHQLGVCKVDLAYDNWRTAL